MKLNSDGVQLSFYNFHNPGSVVVTPWDLDVRTPVRPWGLEVRTPVRSRRPDARDVVTQSFKLVVGTTTTTTTTVPKIVTKNTTFDVRNGAKNCSKQPSLWPWSSLEDEGCFDTSRKLLCLLNPKKLWSPCFGRLVIADVLIIERLRVWIVTPTTL